jgi:DNA polymerase III epsilon subunit-like protein
MSKLAVFDTETSGVPDWSKPSHLPHQPHIVSLGALLVDADTLNIEDEFYAVALHDGWESDKEALDVHGITTEYANEVGVPEHEIVSKFLEWALDTPGVTRVGFSLSFEDRIMRIAMKRYGLSPQAENYKGRNKFCCMQQSRPIVEARSAKTGRVKNPTLVEAHQFFTGDSYHNPHNAMNDALATLAIYRHLKEHHSSKTDELRQQVDI